ncbi:MAG: endonuclease MutS2 [Ignavibacteria bacterium]|nr:endonuclease MutS2 [Ignavibacteria bacterium]
MAMPDLEWDSLRELDLLQVLESVSRRCVSDQGRDILANLRPFDKVDTLRVELNLVQECLDLLLLNEHPPLNHLSDVRYLIRKSQIEGNFLSAPELMTVLESMQTSRSIRRFFSVKNESSPNLHALCSDLLDDKVLEKHIHESIDESGSVRDTASRELQTIRRDIHELEARLRHRLQRILKKYGEDELLQEDFITQRDGRFVLPLRAENKRAVDGIIHGVSQTGSTVFFEPAETYEMNNDLSLLHGREQREIIRILTMLTSEVGSVGSHLEAASEILIHLDTLIARAQYAVDFGGIKPKIVDEGIIELTNVRHPVLVQNARASQSDVVPLSVLIDSNSRGILISGPNAGGKTVAMKTIGLSLIMALCGIFPLGMCTMNMRRIFTAIGDHQSIESNLSTFSSQIIRIRDILAECGEEAVVLIDEVCAGTDPAEGGALAAGVLDSIIERSACFIVTTHQSSLKQYALTHPHVTNASLAFDEEKLQPTFRFQFGVPGNSYAFDLATNVGLPQVVIERGRNYLDERHDELEQSINAMQRFRTEAEQARAKSVEERNVAEKIRKDLEERLEAVKAKRGVVVEEARQEARELLRSANALIENTIREIREGEKSAAEAKKLFEQKKQTFDIPASAESATNEGSAAIHVGSKVQVSESGALGEVYAIEGHNAVVDVGGIKFRINVEKLERITEEKGKKATQVHAKRFASGTDERPERGHGEFSVSVVLDMRGKRVDEALQELEKFIDRAIVAGAPFVEIIHGKGTGALRSAVHSYLSQRSEISQYRQGEIHEGGDGITIATIAIQ